MSFLIFLVLIIYFMIIFPTQCINKFEDGLESLKTILLYHGILCCLLTLFFKNSIEHHEEEIESLKEQIEVLESK